MRADQAPDAMLERLGASPLPLRPIGWLIALILSPWTALCGADWPQWAGPGRDFRAVEPATAVLEGDPAAWQTLWQRDLGLGYSAVSVVGERLVTLDREGDVERIVALSTADGETLWSFQYDAPHLDGMRVGYGTGPHSTPLIHAGRVFAVGTTGLLHAVSLESGELLWKKNLWGELDGTFLVRGYAASPLAVGDKVVVTVGGEGRGFVAFDAATGEEAWRGSTFKNSQSSPVLIDVGTERSEPILVAFANDELVAADPSSGKALWRVEHTSSAAYNIGTPIFDAAKKRLYVSSAYGGGTRGLEVSRGSATELWHTSRLKVHYTNMLLIDDHLYGTTGNAGTVILAGLDTKDGNVLWKDRSVVRSQLVSLGGSKALALTEEGELMRLDLKPSGVTVEGKLNIGADKSWTLPTVVGDRIYIRTEGMIKAYNLSSPVPAPSN